MKKNCTKCGANEELNYRDECSSCERKRRDEDSNPPSSTPFGGVGDMFGTGMPGGMDMDFTTPL